jgi:hypothetical protein
MQESTHNAIFIFIRNFSCLMQVRDIIFIYSDNNKKHKNTLCKLNLEFMNVKAGGNIVTTAHHIIRRKLKRNNLYL